MESVRPMSEQEMADDIASFYYDPLGYVQYAFPWGESGILENETGPDDWQSEQMNRVSTEFQKDPNALIKEAISSGNGIGKTAQVAWLILWAMSTRPKLAGFVTANTENQLRTKTWADLKIWHKRAINAHWFKWTATKFYAVEAPEERFMAAIPWSENNNEAFAGFCNEHVLVIYDEASAIPDAIWEVTEGAMTMPRAMWFVFGTPTHNTGRFIDCFGKLARHWNHHQIDSRNCKLVDKKVVNQWAKDYGVDSNFFRVRVRGEFEDI